MLNSAKVCLRLAWGAPRAQARCLELLEDCWPTSTDLKHTEVEKIRLNRFKQCLCFGLGSLRDSPKSQVQLALLQELLLGFEVSYFECLDRLNTSEKHTHTQLHNPAVMVEPVFDKEDKAYLLQEGYLVEEYKVHPSITAQLVQEI